MENKFRIHGLVGFGNNKWYHHHQSLLRVEHFLLQYLFCDQPSQGIQYLHSIDQAVVILYYIIVTGISLSYIQDRLDHSTLQQFSEYHKSQSFP